MFNILSYLENINHNYTEVSSLLSLCGYHQENTHWLGQRGQGILIYNWWNCKPVKPQRWRDSPRQLKLELLCDPAVAPLSTHSKEPKSVP